MSTDTSTPNATDDPGALSKEERDLFQRIRDRAEEDAIKRICDAVLQDDGNEEARS